MINRFRASSTIVVCLCVSVLAGCGGEPDQIRRYKVAKAPAAESSNAAGGVGNATAEVAAVPARMLAAIAFHGEASWFFKMTGDPEAVGEVADDLNALLKSIRFEGQNPEWDLPEDWSQQPGSKMRFATITVPSEDSPLELSVTKLPVIGEKNAWLLSNINRWRGQLSLDGLKPPALDSAVKKIEFDGGVANLIDIKGMKKGGGMSGMQGGAPFAPFAPFAGGGGRRPVQAPAEAEPAPVDEAPTFDAPKGWIRSDNDRFSAYAYSTGEGEDAPRFTVTQLGAAAASLLPNVNRWRGQAGLDGVSPDDLSSAVEKIEIDGKPASYIKAVGESKTVLGVIQVRGNSAWYYKLIGQTEPTEAQREKFEQLVESVKYESR